MSIRIQLTHSQQLDRLASAVMRYILFSYGKGVGNVKKPVPWASIQKDVVAKMLGAANKRLRLNKQQLVARVTEKFLEIFGYDLVEQHRCVLVSFSLSLSLVSLLSVAHTHTHTHSHAVLYTWDFRGSCPSYPWCCET